jgi:hypothetical protein
MTSEEKKKILTMVEDGKINAEEAMKLLRALNDSSAQVEIIDAPPAYSTESGMGGETGRPEAREFEDVSRRARRLWQMPLWIGVLITVGVSYWLYTLVNASNFGFWFYCAWAPLLLGVLLLALFAGGRTSKWLYVNVNRLAGEWPRNIAFGLPLPLGLASWFLRTFGHNIQGLMQYQVEEILQMLPMGITSHAPLIVNVDEGEHVERVQFYVG